jgi:hypothetical protein
MTYELISNLRRKPDYYGSDGPSWIRSIWNTPSSFDWFLKNNRRRLLQEGAIHRLGRDYFIDQKLFPSVACRILGLQEATASPRALESAK